MSQGGARDGGRQAGLLANILHRHLVHLIARMDRMGKGSRVSHSMEHLVIGLSSPLGIIDVSREWGRGRGFVLERGKKLIDAVSVWRAEGSVD